MLTAAVPRLLSYCDVLVPLVYAYSDYFTTVLQCLCAAGLDLLRVILRDFSYICYQCCVVREDICVLENTNYFHKSPVCIICYKYNRTKVAQSVIGL